MSPGVEDGGGRSRAVVGLIALAVAVAFAIWLWTWIGSRPAHLVVSPTPAEARVQVGELVQTGVTELDLPPGPVTVEVQAPGHQPSSIFIHLEPGSQVVLTPELVPVAEP